MNNVKQLLPKGSREIIIKALKTYQHSLDIIGNGFDDNMNNEHFDCYGLIVFIGGCVYICYCELSTIDIRSSNRISS